MPFHVLPRLRLTPTGPHSLQAKRWRPVHLTQGSLDGACGPYSVVMVLLILGLLRHDEATSYGNWFDPASHKGKFWRLLEKGPALLRDGTDLSELQKLLRRSFGPILSTAECTDSAAGLIDFTLQHLHNGQPVILGIRYSGGAHWLVIIGYETDADGQATKLLALDSASPSPQLCSWNAYLDLHARVKSRYPLNWVCANASTSVRLEDALALGSTA